MILGIISTLYNTFILASLPSENNRIMRVSFDRIWLNRNKITTTRECYKEDLRTAEEFNRIGQKFCHTKYLLPFFQENRESVHEPWIHTFHFCKFRFLLTAAFNFRSKERSISDKEVLRVIQIIFTGEFLLL